MSTQLGMNKELGTAWFTFYTKVRPILVFLLFLGTIADFAQYYTVYFSHIGLLIALVSNITAVVLSVMVAIKSDDNYGTFVRFVKGVLIFECFNIALQISIQQYYEFETTLLEVIIVTCVLGLVSYFLWYRPNIKYFKKRLIQLPAVTQTTSSDILSETNTIQAQPPATPNPQSKKAIPVSKQPRKYCSLCGNPIDPVTKKCQGCGKQYFKGFTFKTVLEAMACTFLVFSLGVNIFLCFIISDFKEDFSEQTKDISTLTANNNQLETDNTALQSTIADLKKEKNSLRVKLGNYAEAIAFYEKYFVMVADDGTDLYHNYDCYSFQACDTFWIYYLDDAVEDGYEPCPRCCD